MDKLTLAKAYRMARIYRAVRELDLRHHNPFISLLDTQVGQLPDRLIGHIYTYSRSDGQDGDWIFNARQQRNRNLYRAYRNNGSREDSMGLYASLIRGQYRLSGKLPK